MLFFTLWPRSGGFEARTLLFSLSAGLIAIHGGEYLFGYRPSR